MPGLQYPDTRRGAHGPRRFAAAENRTRVVWRRAMIAASRVSIRSPQTAPEPPQAGSEANWPTGHIRPAKPRARHVELLRKWGVTLENHGSASSRSENSCNFLHSCYFVLFVVCNASIRELLQLPPAGFTLFYSSPRGWYNPNSCLERKAVTAAGGLSYVRSTALAGIRAKNRLKAGLRTLHFWPRAA